MLKAHRIELDTNDKESTCFAKCCGTARFAFNWALAEWKKMYEAWKEYDAKVKEAKEKQKELKIKNNSLVKAIPEVQKPNEGILRKKLNSIKAQEFPWMLEVTKCAPQMAIIHLGEAFKRFFKHLARYPKFKKKGVHDSFTVSNDHFKIDGKYLKIPHMEPIKMKEELRFKGKLMSLTISRTADKWFASITVDVAVDVADDLDQVENQDLTESKKEFATGVDLGVKCLATLSDGTKIDGPKPLKRLLKKLRLLQKSLHRKVKGSKNRNKARKQLAKLYARIANIRNDFLHKLTIFLANNFSIIGIENLNVKGMMKNRHLSRAISDLGFYEFKRILQYKCAETGAKLHISDQFFASSKTCSACGHKLEKLELDVREWICPKCGQFHDRDVNAAINLMNDAISHIVIGEATEVEIKATGSYSEACIGM